MWTEFCVRHKRYCTNTEPLFRCWLTS